jgi:hypothetical protein
VICSTKNQVGGISTRSFLRGRWWRPNFFDKWNFCGARGRRAPATPGREGLEGHVSLSPLLIATDPQEAVALMERGRDLLRNGDIAFAQLTFQRVAEAGKADAARALATTYDPRYLAEHKLVGIIGDEAKARA